MTDTAIDSSVLVAFLGGEEEGDIKLLEMLLTECQAFLPPVTLSEVLSYPHLTNQQIQKISLFPLLSIEEGYWNRTGETRRVLLSKGRKAHLPDALIAQSCIDHDVPLLTRDTDFQFYAKYCGLKLVK